MQPNAYQPELLSPVEPTPLAEEYLKQVENAANDPLYVWNPLAFHIIRLVAEIRRLREKAWEDK